MFKRKPKPKPKPQPDANEPEQSEKVKRRINWFKISVIVNIVVVAGVIASLGGMTIINQSDTNPVFCKTCHNMTKHVDSYLGSKNLDNVHAKAGVQCKDCHDYPLSAEIASGIKFVTGNYDKEMPRRKFEDAMCLKCHISNVYLASQTDFLVKNPHKSHWPDLKCRNCHISHGEQVDYCGQCHDNGGQRMTGGSITSRAKNPWAEVGAP